MRWALRDGWLRWAGVLALTVLALAACASEDEAGAGMSAYPRPWIEGGQTGSLMPACGLPASSLERGVPASAPGLVLRTEACSDPRAFDELTVRDAFGQPVAFDLVRLPDGAILISFMGGLTPGRYSIDVEPDLPSDEDAGAELDAAIPPAVADAGALDSAQTVEVAAVSQRPSRFGTIEREGGGCNAVITLVPDGAVLPYLGLLAVDLQIDDGPIEPLVRPGALPVREGVARVRLPTARIDAAGDGTHELRIAVRIAGESAPLETFLMTVDVPCGVQHHGGYDEPETSSGLCSVRNAGTESSALAASALPLALYSLHRRRRHRRM